MGKTILTPKQRQFLELAEKTNTIVDNFYLTGGTALAEFYLRHRLSEDIDLFSEKEVVVGPVEAFLQKISPRLGVKKIIRQQYLGLYTYNLVYAGDQRLKIDFNYYPFPRIEKGKYFGRLEVSSVYDIAVNKLHTISMKPRYRDYVDLYLIMAQEVQKPGAYLKKLRLDSKAKFDWPLEEKNLVAALLRVQDLKRADLPIMLVPFEPAAMEEFFLKLAKSLKKEIFK